MPLAPTCMELRGGDGPLATLVASTTSDALDAADEQVDAPFDEGWHAGDIALIPLGARPRCRPSVRRPWGNRATGTFSGTPTTSSTGTCSASRAWNAAPWCCAQQGRDARPSPRTALRRPVPRDRPPHRRRRPGRHHPHGRSRGLPAPVAIHSLMTDTNRHDSLPQIFTFDSTSPQVLVHET